MAERRRGGVTPEEADMALRSVDVDQVEEEGGGKGRDGGSAVYE